MPKNTRQQFIQTSVKLFAEKGFYGTSIADIGNELGLTKQALLHHFGSKEKLYGEVLEHVAEKLDRDLAEIVQEGGHAAAQLEQFAKRFLHRCLNQPDETRLLMRELLDNRRRAETAGKWYLKSYLETLTAILQKATGWQKADQEEALAAIYQLLGSIVYFAVSQPTLGNMFGDQTLEGIRHAYEKDVSRLAVTLCESRSLTS